MSDVLFQTPEFYFSRRTYRKEIDDLDCPSEDGEAESEYSRRVNGMVEKFDSPSFLDEDVPQLLMDTDDFALVSKPAGLHCSGADGDHGTSRPGRGERPQAERSC